MQEYSRGFRGVPLGFRGVLKISEASRGFQKRYGDVPESFMGVRRDFRVFQNFRCVSGLFQGISGAFKGFSRDFQGIFKGVPERFREFQ